MIELYSSDSCVWCRRMKNYLDAKGVRFRTRNISDPDNALRAFTLTGQQSVPITVIGKTAVVGYDTEAIDKAIENLS
ncbi:MAG: glutaredoxin family protein [Ruminococcus flavefaciens]|nr:glutaredoxin family protein [Ruminococcus flavefaciens]MCM1058832.1 glutaredoxin family protein [Eubacterium sp.]